MISTRSTVLFCSPFQVLLKLDLSVWLFISVNHMCQGLNSHYFHIIGDGHQPNSRGLNTHYKDSY